MNLEIYTPNTKAFLPIDWYWKSCKFKIEEVGRNRSLNIYKVLVLYNGKKIVTIKLEKSKLRISLLIEIEFIDIKGLN